MNSKSAPRPAGETGDQRKARHWTWLNGHSTILNQSIRECYERHGRGYWQVTYGDNPVFRYLPAARANTLVAPMVSSYDPAQQFVVVVKDPPGPVGLYKVRIVRLTPAGAG